MQKKRKGSCLKALLIFLFVIVLLLGGAVLLIKHFITGSAGDTVTTSFTAHNADEAIHQLEKLSDEFGYENALSELTEQNTTTVDGDSYYRLQQNYHGIPVYGKTVVCATDENGEVISVTGNVLDITKEIVLTPEATNTQIVKSLNDWIRNDIGYGDVEEMEHNAISDDNLCIFYNPETMQTVLAYQLYWNGYEIIMDAHNAEILSVNTLFRQEMVSGTLQGQQRKHSNVEYSQEEGDYSLTDNVRNIVTYTINSKDKFNIGYLGNISVWESEKIVQWRNQEVPDASAVDAYVYTQSTYDFFAEKLNNYSVDGKGVFPISIFTGLEYMPSDSGWAGYQTYQGNAFNYTDYYNGEPLTYLVFGIASDGQQTLSAYIDTVAHEYMHGITKLHSGLIYSGESGAIDEALSDIFGEFVECWYYRKKDAHYEPDWMHNYRRNIANPSSNKYPEAITDDNQSGEDFVHGYSTVISHAAYLMWNGIDDNDFKKIDTDTLAKLWYRAMLMMPADCDFSTCRQLVEWAALAVDGMTDTQRQCIAEAFDAVGIYAPEQSPEILIDCDQNVVPDAALNVYNVEGELHPRYTVEITGTIAEHELAYSSNIISDVGFSYEDTRTVRSAKSLHLDLPDGYYTFKITDKNNLQYEYIFTVSVSNQGTEDIIELHTDFEDRLLVHITETESAEDNDETPLSIYEIAESATGLHCEWAVNGDFDDDGSDEIYALLCNSSSDYSNGQLWHFTSTENRCIFYIDEAEFEMICDIVKTIPDWLAAEIIDTVDNIDEFISDLERRYF